MDILLRRTPHLLFLLHKFCKCSRNEAPVGSLHPFRLGDVPLSNRLPTGLCFFRHPLPTYLSAPFAGHFPLAVEIIGLTKFRSFNPTT